MTKRSTRHSLILSVLALLVCASMLIGTTFAWFTDSVTSAGNKIQSGTLKIDLELLEKDANGDFVWTSIKDSEKPVFNYDNWEPGYTDVKVLKVVNEGTLALKWYAKFVSDESLSILANVIDVYVKPSTSPLQMPTTRDFETEGYVKVGTLNEFVNTIETTTYGTLMKEESAYLGIALKMQESAGNEYQGLDLAGAFDIQILATQLTAEEDSFGPDYDTDAVYPATDSAVIAGGDTLSAGDVSITLPVAADEAKYTINVENKKVVTDAASETTISLDISLLKDGVKVETEQGVEYLVEIDVGESLIITGVTHKGTDVEDYSYDPSTGIITFTTDSFSPFEVTYFGKRIEINTAEDLIDALTEIKTVAKTIIPGTEGNKAYRENAIFVLENDIVIDSSEDFMYTDSNGAPLHFYGVKGVLDLNGHSITVTEDALLSGKAHANAVILVQYSNLEIIGEGSIIAENKSIPVYAWANCTVDIYSGNYVTNAPERNESAVYVNNATAFVNVYGGNYTDSAYAFNVHDNCGSTPVITLHEGITYADFFKGTIDLIANDISKGRIQLFDGCSLLEYEENGIAMNKVQ